jgi:hypothetical protein
MESPPSPQLTAAISLLGDDPWPDDVIEQFETLERAAPKAEAEQFGDLRSTIIMVMGPGRA